MLDKYLIILSSKNMIHIAIGTKAQFIKMFPVMAALKGRGVEFNLIDLGQHSLITEDLREEFNLKEPNVYLSQGKNISQVSEGLIWSLNIICKGVDKDKITKEIFLGRKGICLIHGDTVSTLLALYLAKRVGIKVAHIEAGLRSYSYLEPFPEEIVRIVCMRFSDLLFAPYPYAFDNLKRMGLGKKSVLLSYNTSWESTLYSLNKRINFDFNVGKFCLVTIHRLENIFFRKKLEFIVELLKNISQTINLVFVQHPPTLEQIKKFALEERLKSSRIFFFKILSHAHFLHLLEKCEFVSTDGGSIQEESYYLDKPCLLLRNFTERQEGLGENVILSKFSQTNIDYFLSHYNLLKRKEQLNFKNRPSQEIVDYIFYRKFDLT
ncbi:MAG: UDP-N-acetylglucosamine 2-epimerase [Candidatus Omnitrophica bacterium]|nr:UDP-N-acetylglucosamine 2-epimerase [Candidatus Omnitrophota bacterium]